RLVDGPDEIEQARIHVGRLVAPPVAKEPVDLLDAGLVVAAVALVGDFGSFLRVDEVELEGPGFGARMRGRGNRYDHRDGKIAQTFQTGQLLNAPHVVCSVNTDHNASPYRLLICPRNRSSGVGFAQLSFLMVNP